MLPRIGRPAPPRPAPPRPAPPRPAPPRPAPPRPAPPRPASCDIDRPRRHVRRARRGARLTGRRQRRLSRSVPVTRWSGCPMAQVSVRSSSSFQLCFDGK
ncbi:hypothetical protein F9L07_07400 [Pimelobacter simplex]|uniref:Uncharacterized protein n=1 Tax=Nocardioides simplex TaxID=2045 RepID=A0A7J5E0H3_NOCSI|nr:hypothetical protein F9L07_07400 [Pimelobacter simplex]